MTPFAVPLPGCCASCSAAVELLQLRWVDRGTRRLHRCDGFRSASIAVQSAADAEAHRRRRAQGRA